MASPSLIQPFIELVSPEKNVVNVILRNNFFQPRQISESNLTVHPVENKPTKAEGKIESDTVPDGDQHGESISEADDFEIANSKLPKKKARKRKRKPRKRKKKFNFLTEWGCIVPGNIIPDSSIVGNYTGFLPGNDSSGTTISDPSGGSSVYFSAQQSTFSLSSNSRNSTGSKDASSFVTAPLDSVNNDSPSSLYHQRSTQSKNYNNNNHFRRPIGTSTYLTDTGSTYSDEDSSFDNSADEEFFKFIPVVNKVKFELPKIPMNDCYPDEWEMVQMAFQHDHLGPARSSKSDLALITKPKNKTKNTCKKLWRKLRSMTQSRVHSTYPKSYKELHTTVDETDELFPTKFPKRFDDRFDLALNDDFLTLHTKEKLDYNVTLYIEQSMQQYFQISRMKAELVTTAIWHFFHPECKIKCLWFSDISSEISNLMMNDELQPKFTKYVHLKKYSVVVQLSRDASTLIRHKDLCFLSTLALVLEVSIRDMLILEPRETRAEHLISSASGTGIEKIL